MYVSTLTSQNQITVPASLRRQLDLQPGDQLRFVRNQLEQVVVEKVGGVRATAGALGQYKASGKLKGEDVWLERWRAGDETQ